MGLIQSKSTSFCVCYLLDLWIVELKCTYWIITVSYLCVSDISLKEKLFFVHGKISESENRDHYSMQRIAVLSSKLPESVFELEE